MGRVTGRQRTNLLGAISLVAALGAIAFGLPALNQMLPSDRPVPTDRPYEIGGGVSVVPPAGARIDVTETRPAASSGTVLFRLGPVRYLVSVQPFDGTLQTAVARLRQRITGTAGYQVTGTELTVATAGGLDGIQGGYSGPGRGGRYAVFVADGHTIEVTVSGADLDLGRTLPAIDASTRTLRYAPEQAG
ncbi:hypothetical protein Asp14428_45660 [Actinoplanes sp. NBRC 14428]|nr:hypothetical protein [Pseudosporangium ferrugineum]BCJ53091.1 hypothetical protein Asp14428_45660 [Actinoplanes sp. NBRC 14428]